MNRTLLHMHRWLTKHDYRLSRRKAGQWILSDPIDDSQGFRLRGAYAEVVRGAYGHLSSLVA